MRIILVSVLFIVAVGSVITSLSLLSRATFLQITSVKVTGTHLVPEISVETTVENSLAGTWWKIFSKDSIFLYPRHTLEQSIVKDFPPIADVSFSHNGFHTLTVAVTERSPFALACNKSDSEGDATPACFYMDSTGFIYAPAPQFSPGVYVTYTTASTISTSTAIGTFITNPTDFVIARQAISYISGLGLTVVGIDVPAADSTSNNGDFQLSIQRPIGTATATSSPVITVYFNSSQPLDTTLEYFRAFWQNETNKNFQYIDLRYGKDIVFKMQ
jgi:hypothetical protein